MWVRSLGREDPLEEGMATHSSILAWSIRWAEEPGGPQSIGSHRHDSSDLAHVRKQKGMYPFKALEGRTPFQQEMVRPSVSCGDPAGCGGHRSSRERHLESPGIPYLAPPRVLGKCFSHLKLTLE